jgi:hypothetical protein
MDDDVFEISLGNNFEIYNKKRSGIAYTNTKS